MTNMEPYDAIDAAKQILSVSSGMAARGQDYVSIQAAMAGVIADYDEASQTMLLRGIPSGWSEVDDVTDGWQKDDLIAIVGRPGVGKTYIMLYMAWQAWLAGYNVLFASMELGAVQLARRLFGLQSRINPTLIRKGQISTAARAGIQTELSGMGSSGVPFNIIQGGLRKSVDTVQAVAEATNPDAIFVDAAYLLKSAKKTGNGRGAETRRENVADTIEDLKRVNLDLSRPMLISVQFGRTAERVKTKDAARNARPSPTSHLSLAKIGETDVIGQAASLVLGFTTPERTQPQDSRHGAFMKGREGEAGVFQINYGFNPVDLSMRSFGGEAFNPEEQDDPSINAHM